MTSVVLCVFFVELCVTITYKFRRVTQRNHRVTQRNFAIILDDFKNNIEFIWISASMFLIFRLQIMTGDKPDN
jgi:hypothetical protein